MHKKTVRDPRITIREARQEDLHVLVDFLAKLDLHVSGAPPQNLKEKEFKRLLNTLGATIGAKDKRLVVAEDADAGLVGMGYVYVWRSQGIWEQSEPEEFRSGIIDDVWVEPDFRGRGVFRALIQDLVDFAERRHVNELILEYSASNKEAKAVWKKLGFETTGVRAAAFVPAVKDALSKW